MVGDFDPGGMVSDVIDALQRSWRPGYHQTGSMLLASDGRLLSSDGETDYELDYVYELYVVSAYSCSAYHAIIIDATGLYLAIDLHHKQGDDGAPQFRRYGQNDKREYFSFSLDMIYSWVSKALHTLRREAEGR